MTKVMDKYGWAIPIHDAAIVSPAAAADVRKWYAEELQGIYDRREQILTDYFQSIGINGAAQEMWDKLQSKVVPPTEPVTVSHTALK